MDQTVPLIYSPRTPRLRLGWFGRLIALSCSLICLSLLVTAAILRPNPSGLGTHLALGLGKCSFLQAFGIPCPSCGMTTSWAWLVRGNVAASLWVQPMGTLLALITAMFFWGGLYLAVTGRAAHHLLSYLPGGYIVYSLLILALIAWVWKIFIQLHHLDGWR